MPDDPVRRRIDELLEGGVVPSDARRQFVQDGLSPDAVVDAMVIYHKAYHDRRHRGKKSGSRALGLFWLVIGLALFLGGLWSGREGSHMIAFPFLALALYGLFKTLLP